LKICMLARNPSLYSHRRICEAAKARGHEIQVVNTLRCYMNITSHRPELHYNGAPLEGFDAVIPRIGASVTYYGLAVLRQFEVMGVWPLNESVAIGRSRDKLRSLQLLARAGIGLPDTAFAHDPRQTDEVLKLVGGAPVIIKLIEGTQGIGVVLGETESSAKSVIEAFRGANVNILVQEFIGEAQGTDIRAFVLGNKVVAAIQRQGAANEFRANLLGLNVCGVDMLRSKHGPVVLEVNSSPGLEGIEAATGRDVAGALIEFLEQNAKPNRTRTRGRG
jgi:ribosomal protein S6--L-glutamate ligase